MVTPTIKPTAAGVLTGNPSASTCVPAARKISVNYAASWRGPTKALPIQPIPLAGSVGPPSPIPGTPFLCPLATAKVATHPMAFGLAAGVHLPFKKLDSYTLRFSLMAM